MNHPPTVRNRRFRPPALGAVLGVLLRLLPLMPVSCTWLHPKQDFGPPVKLPEKFSASGTAAAPDKWWTVLGDPNLNKLIEKAMANNFDLQSTWARLVQARASARKAGADLWPSLDADGGASRTRRATVVSPRGAGSTSRNYSNLNSLSVGLAVNYELDLWGRVRSTRDASRMDLTATREDLDVAAITLSAEVANTWYELVEQRGQLKLLDKQVKTNEDYLELITLRFRRGQVTATDVLQQRQLLESKKGQKVQAQATLEVLAHQLAILLGTSPGALDVPPGQKLPTLPPLPSTGVPAEWIQRRPDIRSAYLAVQAADRRVAAAIADCFPRISLSVGAETSAIRARNLFDNWLASLAANLTAPLFDGGLRLAEVDRTKAVVSEQANAYGQVVLDSLKEVEDALTQETQQRKYLKSLDEQLELSQQSTDQVLKSYIKGTGGFLRFLTTLLSHQQLQQTNLQAQRELIQFRIDLYRALGGSWPLEQPKRRNPTKTPKSPRRPRF